MTATTPPLTWKDSTHVTIRGRRLVYMAGCDYYRLSWHPQVRQALQETVDQEGLSMAASRVTTGNHKIYEALEKELAAFFNVEAAVLTSTGYGAAITAAQALKGRFTTALIDARAHACLEDACRMWDCPTKTFPHLDSMALGKMLRSKKQNQQYVVVTDALFAHNGTLAPLRDYYEALPGRSLLMVDEAHSAGVLGKHGRGVVEALGLEGKGILQTITLSKAFGVYGGAILCSKALKKRITGYSHYFAGNTPLPLPLAAASRVAVQVLKTDQARRQRLQENIHYFHRQRQTLQNKRSTSPPLAPIVAVTTSSEAAREKLHARLLKAGVFPSYIRYPSRSRRGFFRFALCSEHTRDHLDRLAEALT